MDTDHAGVLLQFCGPTDSHSARCASILDGPWGAFDFTVGGRRFVVPTSFLGVAYFLGLCIWFTVLGRAAMQRSGPGWLTLGVLGAGLCASVFLATLMAIGTQPWCRWCAVTHALNGLLLVVVLAGLRRKGTEDAWSKGPAPPQWALVTPAAVMILAAAGGVWLYYDAVSTARRYWRQATRSEQTIRSLQRDENLMRSEFLSVEAVQLPVRGDDPWRFPAVADDGPHLVVFNDFGCPSCRCFAWKWKKQILPAFPGSGRVEYRHFSAPLLHAAAPDDDSYSTRAALAAEAARWQGGDAAYQVMHDLLFKYRGRQTLDFAVVGAEAGLDGARLVADMATPGVRDSVMADAKLAAALGIAKAPAVFVDGRRVPDLCLGSDAFWPAIAACNRQPADETKACTISAASHAAPRFSEDQPDE